MQQASRRDCLDTPRANDDTRSEAESALAQQGRKTQSRARDGCKVGTELSSRPQRRFSPPQHAVAREWTAEMPSAVRAEGARAPREKLPSGSGGFRRQSSWSLPCRRCSHVVTSLEIASS